MEEMESIRKPAEEEAIYGPGREPYTGPAETVEGEKPEKKEVKPVEGREPFRWCSTVSYKTIPNIVARGYDTTRLVEEGYGVCDILFILFQSRIPLSNEEKMLNYLTILFFDDGMSLPAVISRASSDGRSFMTQAIGAGILAFGHVYGPFQDYGYMMNEYLERAEKENKSLKEMAQILVKEYLAEEKTILGLYPEHVQGDPMPYRVFKKAESLGTAGKYHDFQIEIQNAVNQVREKEGKAKLHSDMVGAAGSAMLDLGFTPEATWAIVVVTRAYGCGAHVMDEMEDKSTEELYGVGLHSPEDYDGIPDRPVPPMKDREKVARPIVARTVDDWHKTFKELKKIKGSGWSI